MFYLNRIEWTTTTYTFNCNQRERLEERRGERDEYLKHLELWQLLRIIRILISIWGVIHHPRVCRIREGTKLRWNERRKGKILRERGGGSGDLLSGGIGLIEAYSWERVCGEYSRGLGQGFGRTNPENLLKKVGSLFLLLSLLQSIHTRMPPTSIWVRPLLGRTSLLTSQTPTTNLLKCLQSSNTQFRSFNSSTTKGTIKEWTTLVQANQSRNRMNGVMGRRQFSALSETSHRALVSQYHPLLHIVSGSTRGII